MSTMKAAFPARPTPLEGRPELRGLLTCLKRLMLCAMSHRTHGFVLSKKLGIRAYFVGTSDLDGKYTLVVKYYMG